jgi:GNAT superfamily N-acetyltransferase
VCFEISPEYRGKGIAKQLLKQICSDAARNGYQYVEAYPEVSGQTSMAFTGPVKLYEKNGFAEFKNDGKTIIMRKHLTKY